jgi:hypothetical protein
MKNVIVIFSIIINMIHSQQDCGINPPTSPDDCFEREFTTGYCCEMVKDTKRFCKQVSLREYVENSQYYNLNNTIYAMTCSHSNNADKVGSKCGITSPDHFTNCTAYSTNTNKCCYYESPDFSACFWLGEGFTTSIYDISPKDITDSKISCSSSYISIGGALFTLIFMFFI